MNIRKTGVQKDGTIEIVYDVPNQNDKSKTDVCSLISKDSPRPEFHAALEALESHVLDILELPAGYEDSLDITGVSFSMKGAVCSAVIKGKKVLQNSNSTFNITTPKKPLSLANEESAGEDLFDDETIEALERCIDEAVLYIKGERNQAELQLVDDDAA